MNGRANDLLTAAEVRQIESQAMQLPGHDAWSLMRRAGAAAYSLLRTRWPEARRIAVCCGSGNNGGDGYVLATLARRDGLEVDLVQIGELPKREPARRAVAQWHEHGGETHAAFGSMLGSVDVVVDALLGIGLDRAPEGAIALAIAAINNCGKPILALDLPSGLNADTGSAPGACVRATMCLSFIAWKRGLWTGVAAEVCGQRQLATLSLPEAAYANLSVDVQCLSASRLNALLPPRARTQHKGQAGSVLIVGGDLGMGGAVSIAAAAAARGGAGLVRVATRAEHVTSILARQPEAMVYAVTHAEDIDPLLERSDVVALGPGLGQSDWGTTLAQRVAAEGKPLVLDADALNLLASERLHVHGELALTPHPGEAARLLGILVSEIERDRFSAVRALAKRYRAVVVLKGAGTLIGAPGGKVEVCPFGNPGMASGGMGDALTGLVAAFRAQLDGMASAVPAAVLAHALAGDRAARDGERGLLASDLIANLRAVVNP